MRDKIGILVLLATVLSSVFMPLAPLLRGTQTSEVLPQPPTIIIQIIIVPYCSLPPACLKGSGSGSIGKPIDPLRQKILDLSQRNLKENEIEVILIIASLIEKEGGNYYSKSNVSAVIQNRLAQNMRLQLDPTVQYSLWQGKKWDRIENSDRKIDSPYNTYKYSGLPPTMIAVPSAESIKAALNPAKTDALYFIHDNAGQIHLAKTFAQHQENIQTYLKSKSS